MAHLAEQHDHESLNRYRRRLENWRGRIPSSPACTPTGPKPNTAEATTPGGGGHNERLRCATGTDELSIRLLGALILVLLDLNLPEAVRFVRPAERRLDRLGGEFAAREQFKGWTARTAGAATG